MMACRTTTKTTTNAFSGYPTATTYSILSSRTTTSRFNPSLAFSTTKTTTIGIDHSSQSAAFQRKYLLAQQGTNDDNETNPPTPTNSDDEHSFSSTSSSFAIDPKSEEAHNILNSLGITDTKQQEQLQKLSRLVVEWNGRLNLISRKDCTVDVVFGRHILPALALNAIPDFLPPSSSGDGDGASASSSTSNPRVIDVGTGGGFPGVPLAIIYPHAQFVLVDSVGKKLKAVQEMVDDLGLTNVQTHHGRVEEMVDASGGGKLHKGAYDVCVGRSVTALPRFCFWIQDLLKKGESVEDGVGEEGGGKLVYIIGGEIEPMVLSRVRLDITIDTLIGRDGVSDKRTLVVDRRDVVAIAAKSGETKVKRGATGKNKSNQTKKSGKENAKGSWVKRDSNEKKQRGYENFKRY